MDDEQYLDTASGLHRITYAFRRKPDGKWKWEADFVYSDD
jgi:hypothetical protein